MLLTIYITGLLVCLAYEAVALLRGNYDGEIPIFIVTVLLWFLSMPMGLFSAWVVRELDFKEEWMSNWNDRD